MRHWRENEIMSKTQNMTCSVCGAHAGRWQQHFNRDTGFGICRRCADWLPGKNPEYTPEVMINLYGQPGINYEPRQTPLEWSALWDAMKAAPTAWVPTTEAMYWSMLECLPPRAQSNGAFLVGEAESHNASGYAIYACFKQSGDDFSAKYMTLAEFRA